MNSKTRRRGYLAAALAVVVSAAAGFAAFRMAVSQLERKVAEVLGPSSEMSALRVGWSGVVIEGLHIAAPSGWPSPDALRAERVLIVPTLRSLVSGDFYRIRLVTVTRPYLSALRKDGEISLALPGLRGEASAPGGGTLAVFYEITLEDGVIEIFDATVATPPLRIRLEQIEARLEDVIVPGLSGRSAFTLDGVVKGAPPDGIAHVDGWVEIGTQDSSITTRLRSVDLVPLAPYLIKPDEPPMRAGRADLDLHSEVRDGRLRAPGSLTITGLELEPPEGVFGTFMGLSRRAAIASLEEKGERITVDFAIEGAVTNPEFSLNEALSTQLTYSLAKALGLSIGGLVEGVGMIGLEGGEAAGDAATGIGGWIWDLFDSEPEKK